MKQRGDLIPVIHQHCWHDTKLPLVTCDISAVLAWNAKVSWNSRNTCNTHIKQRCPLSLVIHKGGSQLQHNCLIIEKPLIWPAVLIWKNGTTWPAWYMICTEETFLLDNCVIMEKLLLVWFDTLWEWVTWTGRFCVKSQFQDDCLIMEKLLSDWFDTLCETESFVLGGPVLKLTGLLAIEVINFDVAVVS